MLEMLVAIIACQLGLIVLLLIGALVLEIANNAAIRKANAGMPMPMMLGMPHPPEKKEEEEGEPEEGDGKKGNGQYL